MERQKLAIVFLVATTVLVTSVCLLGVINYDMRAIINGEANWWSYGAIVKASRHTAFDLYLKKFNKSYSREEYDKRLPNFMKSLNEISILNSYDENVFGLTTFADWSKEEVSRLALKRKVKDCNRRCQRCLSPSDNEHSACKVSTSPIPGRFDWRDTGKVGPILKQDRCLGCWAFSIAGVMESMAAIRGMGFTRLSIQQLLDCVGYRNYGCKGSEDLETAPHFMCDKNMAVTTEKKYPLTLVNEKCKGIYPNGRRIKDYWSDCDVNEDKILYWIANHGPVIAIVNADPWIYYTGGIIQRACTRSHDGLTIEHAIQIVGYDNTTSVPYFIVRNSWGTSFGLDGYVKLAAFKNTCGISEEVYILEVV